MSNWGSSEREWGVGGCCGDGEAGVKADVGYEDSLVCWNWGDVRFGEGWEV